MRRLQISRDVFPLRETFTISRGSKTKAEVVSLILEHNTHAGCGECTPYAHNGETVESVIDQIELIRSQVIAGLGRDDLQRAMPPGAARNVLDCAMWDLEAKQQGKRVWELAGLEQPEAIITAYTLSLDSPQNMQRNAQKNAHRPLLKLKCGSGDDLARIEAVRKGAPDADIIVDINEGWDGDTWLAMQQPLKQLGVSLIEQPLPAGADDILGDHEHIIAVCADESCHVSADLENLAGRYDFINIKLDKTGGLTEAMVLRNDARARGFGIMTGCMVASSLAMAPALLIAQGCEYTDLDGPLLLAAERKDKLVYQGSVVSPARPELWG